MKTDSKASSRKLPTFERLNSASHEENQATKASKPSLYVLKDESLRTFGTVPANENVLAGVSLKCVPKVPIDNSGVVVIFVFPLVSVVLDSLFITLLLYYIHATLSRYILTFIEINENVFTSKF